VVTADPEVALLTNRRIVYIILGVLVMAGLLSAIFVSGVFANSTPPGPGPPGPSDAPGPDPSPSTPPGPAAGSTAPDPDDEPFYKEYWWVILLVCLMFAAVVALCLLFVWSKRNSGRADVDWPRGKEGVDPGTGDLVLDGIKEGNRRYQLARELYFAEPYDRDVDPGAEAIEEHPDEYTETPTEFKRILSQGSSGMKGRYPVYAKTKRQRRQFDRGVKHAYSEQGARMKKYHEYNGSGFSAEEFEIKHLDLELL
jgi:hypothetical protein